MTGRTYEIGRHKVSGRILIFARNYREAERVARRYGIQRHDWRLVEDCSSVFGYADVTVLDTGCWMYEAGPKQMVELLRAKQDVRAIAAIHDVRIIPVACE